MLIRLISPIKIFTEIEEGLLELDASALNYKNDILATLHATMFYDEDEITKGLATYFDEDSILTKYVTSARVTVEEIKGNLMAVCYCVLDDDLKNNKTLLDKVIAELKEEITGQYSDGWGEGFEQHYIRAADGLDIYVSFWWHEDWEITVKYPETFDNIIDGLTNLLEKIEKIIDD